MERTDNKFVNCPLCGSDDYTLRYPATTSGTERRKKGAEYYRCTSDRLGEHGNIVLCRCCGMFYNNPQPLPEKLLRIYREVTDPLYLSETKAREITFQHSLTQLQRFVQAPGRLLDVGCYTGVFMQVAAAAGWRVEGVELSSWAAEIARDTKTGPVYEVTLEQLPAAPGNYDVITFWDVIEHLGQPGRFLQTAVNLLKPGGILAFSTHMVDSWSARLLGTHYPFFMDMHLLHFSKATVRTLLEQQQCDVLRIAKHHRTLRYGYFLEKLAAKFPAGETVFKWLAAQPRLANRFFKIGCLGLVNVFAKTPE